MKKEINWEEEEQKHQQSRRQKTVFYSENSDSDSDGLRERSADDFRSLTHRRRVPRLTNSFHRPYLEKLRPSPPSRLPRRPRKRARDSLDSEQEESLSDAVLETEGGTDWAEDFESSTERRQKRSLFRPEPKAEFVNLSVVLSPEHEHAPRSFPCSEGAQSGYESGYQLAEEDGESGSETLVFIDIPERINLAHFEKSPAPPMIDSDQFDTPLAVVTCPREAGSNRTPAKLRDNSDPKTAMLCCKRALKLKINRLQVKSPQPRSSCRVSESTSHVFSESAVESENLKSIEPQVDPDPILPVRVPLPKTPSSTQLRWRCKNASCSRSLTVPTSGSTALYSPASICNCHSLPSPSVCTCDSCKRVPTTCTCDLCLPGAVDYRQCDCCYSLPSPCLTHHSYPTSLCYRNYEPFLRPSFTYYDKSVIPPPGSPSGNSTTTALPISDTPCQLISGPSLAASQCNFVQSN